MAFKEHEKFWAFLALVLVIAGLAILGTTLGEEASRSEEANRASEAALLARLRILDGAVVGLIGIAGMAAQALFRGFAEEKQASALENLSEKVEPKTGEAALRQDLMGGPRPELDAPPEPIRPDSDGDGIPDDEELPEGVRQEVPAWERP